MVNLTEYEQQRYQRHLQLPNFGLAGQLRLRQAHVAIVGMGGLGCPVSMYLAAAGVGNLSLIDADEVSLSNLQRQVLFTEADVGSNKSEVAAKHLAARNSRINIVAHGCKLMPTNAKQLLADVDLVIDCSDNFYARYLINDTCYQAQIPWVYSSVLAQQGQVALFQPQHSCFRCLFPKLNSAPDCNQAGVLGVMPGMLGTMQASLAIQYLAGVEVPQRNELHMLTAWPFNMRTIGLSQAPDCSLCQGTLNDTELAKNYAEDLPNLAPSMLLGPQQLEGLKQQANLQLIDVRDAHEHAQYNIGGINIPLSRLGEVFEPMAGQRYVFYCQTGKRSALAVQRLLNVYAESLEFQLYSLTAGLATG